MVRLHSLLLQLGYMQAGHVPYYWNCQYHRNVQRKILLDWRSTPCVCTPVLYIGNCVRVRSVEIHLCLEGWLHCSPLDQNSKQSSQYYHAQIRSTAPLAVQQSQCQQSTNLISTLLPSSGWLPFSPIPFPPLPPDNYPGFSVASYSPLQRHFPVSSCFIERWFSITRFKLLLTGLLSRQATYKRRLECDSVQNWGNSSWIPYHDRPLSIQRACVLFKNILSKCPYVITNYRLMVYLLHINIF